MESNFSDWALKKGLKQGTIDKLTQEDLNDFRALKLVDIPSCSKQLGLSLGQAAILENAVKSMHEEDDNEMKRVSRLSPLKEKGNITKPYSPFGLEAGWSKGSTSTNSMVYSLPTETGQAVRPDANIEENMALGNSTYQKMYPREHIKDQSPLVRRREAQSVDTHIYENTSTCVLGVAARERLRKSDYNGEPFGEINVTYHIVREDNKIQLITDLSTEHVTSVPCVPIRIVLLVDRSGSMIHYLGQRRRYTKITEVKRFAVKLIQGLDTGDEAGIVTFGTNADIFYPLTEITDDSKKKMLSKLETLDGGRMCRETNLSAGLRMALKVFKDAIKTPDELLNRKNSILILSDGEVNAGTTDPEALVHEVRQNIRQMAPSLDYSTNQWVTISVVTTGSAVSEAAYLLSKTFSSEAYYYVDKAVNDPTAELFLPVLLRKYAVTWNVSLLIQTFNGAHFVDEECSNDFIIQLGLTTRGKLPRNTEKAYFLYDFPAGKRRQIGVTADIANMLLATIDKTNERKIFQIRLEYMGRGGERRQLEKCIYQLDIDNSNEQVALGAAVKHEVQLATSRILQSAADYVKEGDQKASSVLVHGKTDIQKICNRFGDIALGNTEKHNIFSYAASVVKNMEGLIKTIEGHQDNKGLVWNRIKSVSSAIAREAPTVSETVKHSDILCPLPVISETASVGFLNSMRKLKEKRLSLDKESKADLEALLEDMERTLV